MKRSMSVVRSKSVSVAKTKTNVVEIKTENNKKLTKTSHPSKKKTFLSFSRATRNDYRSVLSWRERGLNKQCKEVLMQEYSEWADNDESIDYLDFLHGIGVPFNTFCDWYQRNADLKELHIHIKQIIGSRRQKLAFFPKKSGADSGTIRTTLRQFHPDWREIHDEDVKNKEKEAAGNVTVILDRIEDTDVPDLPFKRQEIDG